MKKFLLAALLLATPVEARTILFVSNSFTHGANSAAHHYTKPQAHALQQVANDQLAASNQLGQ